MRSCELNKQVVSWKKFNKVTETENTAGEKTGVYTKTYNTPVSLSINVVSGSAIKKHNGGIWYSAKARKDTIYAKG